MWVHHPSRPFEIPFVLRSPCFLPFRPPSLPLRGSVSGSFRRDEFAGLETDDKWFFVLSGRAVAAVDRIIGDVTRATDVTLQVFSLTPTGGWRQTGENRDRGVGGIVGTVEAGEPRRMV